LLGSAADTRRAKRATGEDVDRGSTTWATQSRRRTRPDRHRRERLTEREPGDRAVEEAGVVWRARDRLSVFRTARSDGPGRRVTEYARLLAFETAATRRMRVGGAGAGRLIGCARVVVAERGPSRSSIQGIEVADRRYH
jgi:hypothetical protein